jgi:DNA primase
MEGFMDVIRASTIGIRSTVALMGTALTDEQVSLIKRLSNNIIICLDGDSPGRHAALKVGERLLNEQIEAKVVVLPNDDDPDTFILKHGKDEFEILLKNAKNYNDYKIEALKENVNFSSEEDLAKYINSVLEESLKIDDEIRIEIILKKLAKDYNIGYNTLEKRFQELKDKNPKTTKIQVKKVKKQNRKDKYNMAMEQIIYFMLNNSWVIEQVEKENIIYPKNEERLLTSEIIYFYKKNGYINVADFYTYIQDKEELLVLLNDIVSSNYLDKIDKKDLFPYFRAVKEYSIEMQKKRMEEKMKMEQDPMKKAIIAKEIVRLKIGE